MLTTLCFLLYSGSGVDGLKQELEALREKHREHERREAEVSRMRSSWSGSYVSLCTHPDISPVVHTQLKQEIENMKTVDPSMLETLKGELEAIKQRHSEELEVILKVKQTEASH